jgi:NAD(P)H-flavin reductase
LPATETFKFYAGQYVELILKDGKRRSYSMANPPHSSAALELHIRHLPGGLFTDHVFGVGATQMKEREILRIEGPLGSFFLREDSDLPIVMLASGTGFAPIKSIIEHMAHQGIKRPVTLYWGGRRPADLYMHALAHRVGQRLFLISHTFLLYQTHSPRMHGPAAQALCIKPSWQTSQICLAIRSMPAVPPSWWIPRVGNS